MQFSVSRGTCLPCKGKTKVISMNKPFTVPENHVALLYTSYNVGIETNMILPGKYDKLSVNFIGRNQVSYLEEYDEIIQVEDGIPLITMFLVKTVEFPILKDEAKE